MIGFDIVEMDLQAACQILTWEFSCNGFFLVRLTTWWIERCLPGAIGSLLGSLDTGLTAFVPLRCQGRSGRRLLKEPS